MRLLSPFALVMSSAYASMSALDVRTFSSVIKDGLVQGKKIVLCYDLNSTGVVQRLGVRVALGDP